MIRKLFKLRKEYSISFYLIDFLFRKILRQNAEVPYPLHHTSTIHGAKNLFLGKGTFPGDSPGVYINAFNGVNVGDYVNIGPHVSLVSANHDLIHNEIHQKASPIEIGAYSWIGSHVVILPGVRLGEHTIVAAGAIVTKSFPEGFQVIGGNPAEVIKVLDEKMVRAARISSKRQ